jgi:cytochrome c-type biogenesis protein CcmH
MMGFAIGATLMAGITLALLLSPFRRRPATADFSRQQLNAAIYRDQFAELERDRSEGALSQADFDQAHSELQRRLLEDSRAELPGTANPTASQTSRAVPLALAIALPVGAVLLYLLLGNPAALNPPPPEQRFTADDIERMVSGLAAKLEKEPENLQGWVMLARSYKAMGRLPDAVRAFEHAIKLVETSAELLVDYADALAASTGGFTDKVNALIDKALQLDPANAQALWLRGTAAFENQRYDVAIADWQRLLPLLEPDSENARVVAANIAEAQAQGGKAKPAKNSSKSAAQAFVKGRVELARDLADKVSAADTVMVIARPADGTRMPVAVLRVKASQLPLAFTLDDALAMSPDHKLSKFSEVMIEARISRSGQATVQTGDLLSAAQTVRVGSKDLRIVVDQVKK